MTKERKSAYKVLDDGVMYLVNRGVRAWNWTTGKTKTELANGLVAISPIPISVGAIIGDPAISPIITGSSILSSHIWQIAHSNLARKEQRAQDTGCKDLRVETTKEELGSLGAITLGMSGAMFTSYAGKCSERNGMMALGAAAYLALNSLSFYTMRADYLPPRKNVFSRAKDKLVEMIDNFQPLPQPVPIPISNYIP